jgi:hypothetical protein
METVSIFITTNQARHLAGNLAMGTCVDTAPSTSPVSQIESELANLDGKLPNHPAQFANVEIGHTETRKPRSNPRLFLFSKSFRWTNLAISLLE